MVLDLTNSYRYYNFNDEFPDAEGKEIAYRKVCGKSVKGEGAGRGWDKGAMGRASNLRTGGCWREEG